MRKMFRERLACLEHLAHDSRDGTEVNELLLLGSLNEIFFWVLICMVKTPPIY